MTRSIRIIEPPKPKPSFSQRLEERARALADRSKREASRTAPTAGMEREIALTLDHLNRVREVHDDERHRLHRWEGTVNNELLQIEPRGPEYVDRHTLHRQILRSRLFKIDDERRQLNLHESKEVQGLQDRLLQLLNAHAQLTP